MWHITRNLTQQFVLSHIHTTNTLSVTNAAGPANPNTVHRVSDVTVAHPLSLEWPPPARTEVEERSAGSEAAEGEHRFHNGHQDERHPQNDCGRLVSHST